MRRIYVLALLIIVMGFGTDIRAEVIPQPSGGDYRVQAVAYDPNQVVVLSVSPDTALAVELSPAERIENVAIGAGSGWQVTANKRGDHLFIKSYEGANPTNLVVVTDVRQYMFSLVVGNNANGPSPYIMRFTYPDLETLPVKDSLSHASYRFSGSRALRPKSMSDDGRSTEIIWGEEVAIPAIYAIDAQGRESIVNGAMREGAYVIDAIAPQYVFRSGRLTTIAKRKREKSK